MRWKTDIGYVRGVLFWCLILFSSMASSNQEINPPSCSYVLRIQEFERKGLIAQEKHHGDAERWVAVASVVVEENLSDSENCKIDGSVLKVVLIYERKQTALRIGDRVIATRYLDDKNVIGRIYRLDQMFVERKLD